MDFLSRWISRRDDGDLKDEVLDGVRRKVSGRKSNKEFMNFERQA